MRLLEETIQNARFVRLAITIYKIYYKLYIDRCELWRFIREMNSGISHVKYQFFPPELLLDN